MGRALVTGMRPRPPGDKGVRLQRTGGWGADGGAVAMTGGRTPSPPAPWSQLDIVCHSQGLVFSLTPTISSSQFSFFCNERVFPCCFHYVVLQSAFVAAVQNCPDPFFPFPPIFFSHTIPLLHLFFFLPHSLLPFQPASFLPLSLPHPFPPPLPPPPSIFHSSPSPPSLLHSLLPSLPSSSLLPSLCPSPPLPPPLPLPSILSSLLPSPSFLPSLCPSILSLFSVFF